jgi:hypothetical protein
MVHVLIWTVLRSPDALTDIPKDQSTDESAVPKMDFVSEYGDGDAHYEAEDTLCIQSSLFIFDIFEGESKEAKDDSSYNT